MNGSVSVSRRSRLLFRPYRLSLREAVCAMQYRYVGARGGCNVAMACSSCHVRVLRVDDPRVGYSEHATIRSLLFG